MALPAAEVGLASVLKTAGALFLILAILFIGFWFLRKYGPALGVGGVKKAGLELIGQLPLGPKRGLAVVRFEGRTLVLGVTEHQINLVAELPENGLAKDTETDAQDFAKCMEDEQAGPDS